MQFAAVQSKEIKATAIVCGVVFEQSTTRSPVFPQFSASCVTLHVSAFCTDATGAGAAAS